jgi:hypothetical protein
MAVAGYSMDTQVLPATRNSCERLFTGADALLAAAARRLRDRLRAIAMQISGRCTCGGIRGSAHHQHRSSSGLSAWPARQTPLPSILCPVLSMEASGVCKRLSSL